MKMPQYATDLSRDDPRLFGSTVIAIPPSRERGGEHHAYSTLARRRQPVDGRVADRVAVRPGLCRGDHLDNHRAWVVRRSVCRRGICHSPYVEEWGEVLLGLALLVAPWAIGYESVSATVNSIVSGILVILFGACELVTDREFTTWRHDRWHDPAN